MKLSLPVLAVALIMPGLLGGCIAGRTSRPVASSAVSPAVAGRAGPDTAAAYLRGFFERYVASHREGHGAAAALLRSYLAAWYLPIVKAPPSAGPDDVDCGLPGAPAAWTFSHAGTLAGQTVIVAGSRPRGAPQELWIAVSMEPGTRKITGITCGIGGADVTSAAATDAAASLYGYYTAARRRGESPGEVISGFLAGGPSAASSYLKRVRYALARRQLGYDPVTCAAAGVPHVSVGTATVVAGGSVGLVVARANRVQALVTVVRGAKGWTAGDIACRQPLDG